MAASSAARLRYVAGAGVPQTTTLIAGAGALTETGQAASFTRLFAAQAGESILTGSLAAFTNAASCGAGSLTLGDLSTAFAIGFSSEAGAFVLTGMDAMLDEETPEATTLIADTGQFLQITTTNARSVRRFVLSHVPTLG